jgi:Flp pilus assembly pilin Flp
LKTDERGASALEFAIFVGILAFGLLNTADISDLRVQAHAG